MNPCKSLLVLVTAAMLAASCRVSALTLTVITRPQDWLRSILERPHDSAVLTVLMQSAPDRLVPSFVEGLVSRRPGIDLATVFDTAATGIRSGMVAAEAIRRLESLQARMLDSTIRVLVRRLELGGLTEVKARLTHDRRGIQLNAAGVPRTAALRANLIRQGRFAMVEAETSGTAYQELLRVDSVWHACGLPEDSGRRRQVDSNAPADAVSGPPGRPGGFSTMIINPRASGFPESPLIGAVHASEMGSFSARVERAISSGELNPGLDIRYGLEPEFPEDPDTLFGIYALPRNPERREGAIGNWGILNTVIGFNEASSQTELRIDFTPAGALALLRLTERNQRRFLIILIDGRVHSAALNYGVIAGGRLILSGGDATESVRALANLLKTGPLPIPVH